MAGLIIDDDPNAGLREPLQQVHRIGVLLVCSYAMDGNDDVLRVLRNAGDARDFLSGCFLY